MHFCKLHIEEMLRQGGCEKEMCNIVGSMKTMGFESLANNIGIGMVREDGTILANLHHIYITPPSHEFLPHETMVHHH